MPSKSISELIANVEQQVAPLQNETFSPHAFIALKDAISTYILELVAESVKVSKRHRADSVSIAHVEQAAAYLVAASSRRLFRHLGTVGGILLGAAVSNLLAMVSSSAYTASGVTLTSILGVVGAFAVALHAANE